MVITKVFLMQVAGISSHTHTCKHVCGLAASLGASVALFIGEGGRSSGLHNKLGAFGIRFAFFAAFFLVVVILLVK